MKFTKSYRIKWHDTDANRQVRPSALVTYLQETASEHLIHLDISSDELRDRYGLAFILGSISVRAYKPLFAGDGIEVQTWTCEGRGFRHNRCFCVWRNGECIAEAISQWALIDLKKGSLVKIEDMPCRIEPDEPITLPDLPTRLHIPPISEMELAGERRIVYSDIDYNGHMNNTHYPDMLCDFLPDMRTHRVTGMVLSYRHEAAYGQVLRIYRAKVDGGYLLRTTNGEGNVCTEALLLLAPAQKNKELI